jgi:hypothetical protein
MLGNQTSLKLPQGEIDCARNKSFDAVLYPRWNRHCVAYATRPEPAPPLALKRQFATPANGALTAKLKALVEVLDKLIT